MQDVKIGICLPTFLDKTPPDLDYLCEYARRAEKLGFDSLWVIEHLLRAGPSYKVTFLEPLTTLAAIVSSTSRIRLGTGILILPLRNPLILAKETASLDALSKGRLTLGIGVGWYEKEFHALQIPVAGRGKRADEMLEILKKVWTEDEVNYNGRYFKFKGVTIDPKPVQKPHIPIWVGGGSSDPAKMSHDQIANASPRRLEAVLRRVARFGDGFITSSYAIKATGNPMELVEKDWQQIVAYAKSYGRDPSAIQRVQQDHFFIASSRSNLAREFEQAASGFTTDSPEHIRDIYLAGTPEDIVPRIQARIRGGIGHLYFNPISPDMNQLERFGKEVLPQLR